jgi:hypothetical protein
MTDPVAIELGTAKGSNAKNVSKRDTVNRRFQNYCPQSIETKFFGSEKFAFFNSFLDLSKLISSRGLARRSKDQ